jgi:hypothetical protein
MTKPHEEIVSGHLRDALDALSRIPVLERGFSAAIAPELGAQALSQVIGPPRTWIYRTLEAIRDEKQLQRLILRLSHVSLPLYAQILHGPLEHGKDVVVLLQKNGRRVLRMYQAKIGDIATSDWRQAKEELEEMFLVPLSTLLVPADPVPEREGILICNGHPGPYVTPVMEGWFDVQKRDHGRNISLVHLDGLVQWIERDNLVVELRAVLCELGIPVL